MYKLLLITLSSICVQISFTSPNPPPTKEERARYELNGAKDMSPPMGGMGPVIKKTFTHLINITEAATLIMSGTDTLTPTYTVGVLLMTCAASLRLACYCELGRAFTFHLSVQKDQKLVTTRLYSIVRHPSYTASILYFPGAILSQLCAGSWFYNAGGWSSPVGVFVACMWLWAMWASVAFCVRRTREEDEVLHREFGPEWEEWAQRTPYRLIPYLY